ncbi:MAG: S8 family serine peptidase, partial [bacterium]
MKRVFLFLLTPFLVFSAYREGEILVKLKDKRAISSLPVSILSQEHLFNSTYKLSIANNVEEAISLLKNDPNVVYAEPNYIRQIQDTGYRIQDTIPNDPDFGKQWGLTKISAPSAWDIEKGSSNVIIAILDTGVDYNHLDLDDLDDKVIKGYDFGNDDDNPMDTYDHGTHVAGIAGAETNNKTGIAGMSWNCKILAIKVFPDYSNETDDAKIVQGINSAVEHGAKVINMSFGGTDVGETLKDACDYAYNKGVFLVAAAGNDNIAP